MNRKLGRRKTQASHGQTQKATTADGQPLDRPHSEIQPASAETTGLRGSSKHWIDYATALFGFIAAIGGFAAAIFAGWQALIAREGTIVANRAFVFSNAFQYITYQEPSDPGRVWLAFPLIENAGNTQTRNMTTFTQGTVGLPTGFPWGDPSKQQPRAHRMIAPKGSSIAQTVGNNPEGFKQMQNGPKFGAAGIIRYQDILGGWHLTEYCYIARPLPTFNFATYPANQPVRAEGELCDRHNCSDDECGPDWKKRAME
ncbi:hypothetical protein [Bradyrhizobium sp. HKCCYLRH1062]|uniref:hypothetical protein n=1 Tax=unclassified Bradyrhizobium TaxID=2631580 RepID=UPI003EC150DE